MDREGCQGVYESGDLLAGNDATISGLRLPNLMCIVGIVSYSLEALGISYLKNTLHGDLKALKDEIVWI